MPRAIIAGEVEKKFSTLIHVLFDKLSRAKTHFDIWYALQQYRKTIMTN